MNKEYRIADTQLVPKINQQQINVFTLGPHQAIICSINLSSVDLRRSTLYVYFKEVIYFKCIRSSACSDRELQIKNTVGLTCSQASFFI